mmetsp:Transcript_6733/g.7809  ORF Transcript_6733/g.7809 Transcript_6733/m.7809 type:complete len:193 (-) Transcript_6733:12-590(-)
MKVQYQVTLHHLLRTTEGIPLLLTIPLAPAEKNMIVELEVWAQLMVPLPLVIQATAVSVSAMVTAVCVSAGNSASSNIPVQEQEEEEKVHTQIQMRERKRQTQQRLDEARQAESTLSEVAKLYGKMSTLITQQGETLEKIEDDVESALVDVSAGQEELTKLYSIKKGNRPLIVKTFFILNFLVVFMRTYYKK